MDQVVWFGTDIDPVNAIRKCILDVFVKNQRTRQAGFASACYPLKNANVVRSLTCGGEPGCERAVVSPTPSLYTVQAVAGKKNRASRLETKETTINEKMGYGRRMTCFVNTKYPPVWILNWGAVERLTYGHVVAGFRLRSCKNEVTYKLARIIWTLLFEYLDLVLVDFCIESDQYTVEGRSGVLMQRKRKFQDTQVLAFQCLAGMFEAIDCFIK